MKGFIIKLGVGLGVGVLGLGILAPVFAKEATMTGEPRKEIRQEVMERVASKTGVLRNLANKFLGRAAISGGILSAISGTSVPATLTVQGKEGKNYVVNVDAKTQLRRRFWGKATLDEFQVGDTINVIGQWADDEQTSVNAKLVRDVSIQKRNGVFIGTVKAGGLGASVFTLATVHRGDQQVSVDSTTKFVNRRGQVIKFTDIKEGHRVRVKGLWDRKSSTITEVTRVKDYNLPAKVINSSSPSATTP